LRNFPGRTLEELDEMDWFRYLRALQASGVEAAEDARIRFFDGDAKPPDPSNKAAHRRHNELLKTWLKHDRLISDGTD